MSKEDSKIDAGAILDQLRNDMIFGAYQFETFNNNSDRVPFAIKTTDHCDTTIPLLAMGNCPELPHDPFITFIDSCHWKNESFGPLDIVSEFFQRCVSMPRVMTDEKFVSICEKENRSFLNKYNILKEVVDYTDFGVGFPIRDYLDRNFDNNKYICSIYLRKIPIADTNIVNPVITFNIHNMSEVRLFSFIIRNITRLYMQISLCQSYKDPLLIDIPEKLHNKEYLDYFK